MQVGKDARASFFAAAGAHTRYLMAEADGLRFLVSTRDRNIGGRLFATGIRPEMHTLAAAVERLGRPGGVLLDIGANIGTTCLPALSRHGFTSVVAVEPAPENVALLRANALLNSLDDRLVIVEAALSDRVGEANLVLHPRNSGAHNLGADRPRRTRRNSIPVHLETVDSLAEQGVIDPAEIGLVWIDAQRSEQAILSAATSIAGRCPIVLETQRGGHEWISGLGYTTAISLRHGQEAPASEASRLVLRATNPKGGNTVELLLLP